MSGSEIEREVRLIEARQKIVLIYLHYRQLQAAERELAGLTNSLVALRAAASADSREHPTSRRVM